jgi:cobalt-zinc-cadmium efflux system outer membrane protein
LKLPPKFWTLLALATAPAAAQEGGAAPIATVPAIEAPAVSDEPQVTVDDLVRRALESSPQLRIAVEEAEAARQRSSAARSRPNPTLELVPRLLGSREAAESEITLSQPLDIFGQRRAQAVAARSELNRAELESTLARRALIAQVKNSASELFGAQEAEALGRIQVEVARLFREAAARRAQLGDVPPVQVQRAELELLRAQNELSNAQADRLVRRAALNQLIGQPPESPLRVALPELASFSAASTSISSGVPSGGAASTSDVAQRSEVGDLASVREKTLPGALTERPDVVSAGALLESRRAQVQVLRRQRLPEVALQARRSPFLGERGSYALRAVVTMPLFDFGSLKSERRAAQAEVRAQEAQVELLRAQVSLQVEQALVRLRSQQQSVARYREGIVPLTLELLRKTQIGYDQGASTYLEVLEAQRSLRQVQTEYLQALVGVRIGEAALETALGAPGVPEPRGEVSNPTGPTAPPGTAPPGTVPPDAVSTGAPATLQAMPQGEAGGEAR